MYAPLVTTSTTTTTTTTWPFFLLLFTYFISTVYNFSSSTSQIVKHVWIILKLYCKYDTFCWAQLRYNGQSTLIRRSWLKHCATRRGVPSSIPGGVQSEYVFDCNSTNNNIDKNHSVMLLHFKSHFLFSTIKHYNN
jgi:hypothetical protein